MNTLEKQTTFEELVVVKVGTSTVIDQESTGCLALDQYSINQIGHQITTLANEGVAVAIVSSGAIAAGYAITGEERAQENRKDTVEKQRMACLGQTALMHSWQKALKPRYAGQLLFTSLELAGDEGSELQRVANRLFIRGDIPIANENDALSHAEITFGDNDTLAARFASLLHASGLFARTRLVILSDIDGVYQDVSNRGSILPVIDNLETYRHVARGAGSANGTGGMASKFNAVKIATDSEVDVYIAHGRTDWVIQRALAKEIGTHFPAPANLHHGEEIESKQ